MNDLYRRKLTKIHTKIDKIASKGKDNTLEYYKYVDELIQKGDYSALEQVLSYYYEIEIVNFENITDVKKKTWSKILFQTTSTFLKKLSTLYKSKGVYQNSFDIFTTDLNAVQITLDNPLSATYSSTGYTQSIFLQKTDSIINIGITNSDIYSIQIFRSEWVSGEPTNIELLQNINTGTQSSFTSEIPLNVSREYLITTYERPDYLKLNYKLNITKNSFIGQIIEIESYSEDVNYLIKNKLYASLIGEIRTSLQVYKDSRSTDQGATYSLVNTDTPGASYYQNIINKYSIAVDLLLS